MSHVSSCVTMLLIATLIIKTTEENVSPKSNNILAFFEVNSMFNFFFLTLWHSTLLRITVVDITVFKLLDFLSL